MIGRKHSKSVITRLEALESKKLGSLIFEVAMEGGETKRVTFKEFMSMREEPHTEENICYDGFPNWRIVEGANMKEVDELINYMCLGGDKIG